MSQATERRDYDRPVMWQNRKCYECGVLDGRRGKVVSELTLTESAAWQLPPGVALCVECICDRPEVTATYEQDVTRIAEVLAEYRDSEVESFKQVTREINSDDNVFGSF